MTGVRFAIGAIAAIACLAVGAIIRGPQPGSAPRIATPTLTVRDATTLIASHLLDRRRSCAVTLPTSEIDIAGFAARTISTWHLHSCLRAVDELACADAAGWGGTVALGEPHAPRACLVMLGLADARETL